MFSKSKEESSFKANAVPGPLKGQDEAIPAVLLEDEAEKRLSSLNWLASRESWKLKCQAAKSQLKTKTLAVKRLRELRNDLKSKSQQLKIEIDHLRDSLSESQNEVAQLKARLQVSEKELTEVKKKVISSTEGQRAPGYTYSIYFILLSLQMIFKANLGFRNVSMAMTVLCCECKIERAPSHEICVQWALKVGFYKLSVLKKREDCQWIWIVDHAVKAGVDKCLIVLGIRLDQIKGRRDLTLSLDDVAPLGVISMRVSNGKTVNEEFEKLAAKTGIPKALVIDHGSDLRSGAQKFCRKHSGVLLFYDIVHKIALAISSRIKENSRWQAFTIAAARAKKELQLTEFHRLGPP